MASSLQNHKYNGLAREALFKQLLHGSSPRNPTYILGRVISDFTAQGSTELSVSRLITITKICYMGFKSYGIQAHWVMPLCILGLISIQYHLFAIWST